MNPTYKVGDVVQIISEEEVYSYPTDDRGNFILAHFPSGADDSFHRDKLPICGCSAVITGIFSITKGDGGNLYELTPLFAKDKTVFAGAPGSSPPLNFTLISFLRPRFLPCPSMIC